MDLFTEHYAGHERAALEHDTARAVAVGVHVAEARRMPRLRHRTLHANVLRDLVDRRHKARSPRFGAARATGRFSATPHPH
jgi:hypothetical protein